MAAKEADSVVTDLALRLEQNYVFPDVGKAYAGMLLKKLKIGAYANLLNKDEFAKAVTADLQALHKDGHLRLFAPKPVEASGKDGTKLSAEGAIGRSGWITDGVAYIEFMEFPSDAVTLGKLKSFLDAHASAKSLIIDIRRHHGGDIKEVDLLGAYLFSEDHQVIHLDTREAVDAAGEGPFTDGPSIRRISGPEGVVRRTHTIKAGAEASPLRDANVFLLTSKKTASAAEHFAMAMKQSGRATLIGEITYGAGHFGNEYELENGYSAFIPVGRSFDPATGAGWEGVGVAPNVAVPADKALDEALKLAGSGRRARSLR